MQKFLAHCRTDIFDRNYRHMVYIARSFMDRTYEKFHSGIWIRISATWNITQVIGYGISIIPKRKMACFHYGLIPIRQRHFISYCGQQGSYNTTELEVTPEGYLERFSNIPGLAILIVNTSTLSWTRFIY